MLIITIKVNDRLTSSLLNGLKPQDKAVRAPKHTSNILVMKLGNPEIARRLLLRGANPNLKDRTGFAVIHDAARAGFLDTLQTLLEFQADVNIEDNEGNLPLHLAAKEGHLPVVEFLVKHTASNVGHRNHSGDTAFDLARLYGKNEVVSLLEANGVGVRVGGAANLQ
uniref:Cyclin-dependent kinase 4 inhibitor C n=1 Tax=Spermophilus dauricus TaxID=99837 RepID=A0A8C9UVG1_SPEDA